MIHGGPTLNRTGSPTALHKQDARPVRQDPTIPEPALVKVAV